MFNLLSAQKAENGERVGHTVQESKPLLAGTTDMKAAASQKEGGVRPTLECLPWKVWAGATSVGSHAEKEGYLTSRAFLLLPPSTFTPSGNPKGKP